MQRYGLIRKAISGGATMEGQKGEATLGETGIAYFLEARSRSTCTYSRTLHSRPRVAGTAYE